MVKKNLVGFTNCPWIIISIGDEDVVDNDLAGRTEKSYNVNEVLPRLFVLDKYRIIRKEETGLCSTCLCDKLAPLLDRLLEE